MQHDSLHAEANLLLAQISCQRLRPAVARKCLATVLHTYPGNASAIALQKDITQATAPYFKVNSTYAADDQPLQALAMRAEASWFQSWLLSPTVQVQANRFGLPAGENQYRSTWLRAANKMSVPGAGLSLTAGAGYFQYQPTGRGYGPRAAL